MATIVITTLMVNLTWILYSMLEGMREGFYWHFKSNTTKDCQLEIHPIFSLQRGIVLILIVCILFASIGWYSIISVLSMMLIFSFFHNGTYYTTRNKLDKRIYLLGWRDQSDTSTARMTKIMTYRNRTILMILGIVIESFVCLFFIH